MTDARDPAAARIQRAHDTLDAARTLADTAHWNACVNRLYYACFHAAMGLLTTQDLAPKTHTGTRTLLFQHFVVPGHIEREHADFYSQLFDTRLRADYEVFVELDSSVQPWLAQAEDFVAACAALIDADSP